METFRKSFIKNDKKGVSPLIAAVLLIAFTMAMAAILTAWISNFQSTKAEETAEQEEIISCLYKNVKVLEGLSYLNETHFKTYLLSIGNEKVEIHRIQVYLKNEVQPPQNLSDDISISRDGTSILVDLNEIYPDLSITSNNLDKIKFVVKNCEDTYALVSDYISKEGQL